MKIQVTDPYFVPSLVSALNETECCAAQTADDAVEVFLPWLERGTDAVEQASAELLFFVRAWGLVHPEFEATVS